MTKRLYFSVIVATIGLMSINTSAQKYAVKAYGDLGLGTGISMSTEFPSMTTKSSSNAFGIDFGYTFWEKNANSLEANVGIGYRIASSRIDISEFSYNYAAPAAADEDGNTYQRYTTLSDIEQKINLGYFNIPIYLQYQYRAADWLGIYADFGFGFGFKCNGSIGSTKGIAKTYGVYPEYDQLVIKADYVNDFGDNYLDEAATCKPHIKSFSASLLAGVGFEFYVSDPISFDLGVRYNPGLSEVFKGRYDINLHSNISAENAPVTYTVADGQKVKALSDYITRSRLNHFSLLIGLKVRF